MITLLSASDANFDNDLDVDGADFLTWQRNFGGPGGASTGDATGDGQVNGLDFAAWKTAFGPTSATPTGHAVPETTTAILLAVALAVNVARRGICFRGGRWP
jgi:hypothetical protein